MNKLSKKPLVLTFMAFIAFGIFTFLSFVASADSTHEKKKSTPKTLSVQEKKENFKKMILPALNEAYAILENKYKATKELIEKNPNDTKLTSMKKQYNAKDNKELLIAIKPHPKSIALAQASIESGWGTSRFFKQANNIFGVWSFNKNEPRIAASENRGDKTIYLKKYASIKESILDYYKSLSRKKIYRNFKQVNYTSNDPYKMVKELTMYSETGDVYTKKLAGVLKYNKFYLYD